MANRSFFRYFISGPFWLNVAILVAGTVLLGYLTLAGLNAYTRHGQALKVPVLKGLYVDQARTVLGRQNLILKINDSSDIVGEEPGKILDQDPLPNSLVKQNRSIYVTVTSGKAPMTRVPTLVGTSLKQAKLNLEMLGLSVLRVDTVPDIASGNVREAKLNGVSLQPGASVPTGSALTLVIGYGNKKSKAIPIPDLEGLKLAEARDILSSQQLYLGAFVFDEGVRGDTAKAVIYRQSPMFDRSGTIRVGDQIDVYLRRP